MSDPIEEAIRSAYLHALGTPRVITDGKQHHTGDDVNSLAAQLGYRVAVVPRVSHLPADGTAVPLPPAAYRIAVVRDPVAARGWQNVRNEQSLRALKLAGMGEEELLRLREALGLPPRDEVLERYADEIDGRNEREQKDADDRYAQLLAANRKLVARMEALERIEDERDRVLGQLEDALRLLAKRNTAPNPTSEAGQ